MDRKFHTIQNAFILLFLIISIGIIGFMWIEHYNLIEAFYMTVITMSTVGFREIRDLSTIGMLFTSILIIISFGLFAYVISSLTRYILDGGFRVYLKNKRVNKQLSKIENHVIVCGYGRNGRQAVRELLTHDENIVVIEKDEEISESVDYEIPRVTFITGDAIHDEVLEQAKVQKAKALITTLPNDANNLFVVLTARQLNPMMIIISRASDDNSDIKLKRAGATNVIMPDKIGGARMAKLVAQPDIIEFLDNLLIRSQEQVNIVEISCKDIDSCFINQTIAQMDIRNVSGANLIGIKTEKGEYIFNPAPDIKIMPDAKLFALGKPSQIERLKTILTNKPG